MPDVSIMISAKDNLSGALQKMSNMTTSFRKDVSSLDKELTALKNNRVQLKVDLENAKNKLNDAKKAYKEFGDEIMRTELMAAQADYDNIKQNLDLVDRAARQTAKDMRDLNGTMSKTENSFGGKGGDLGSRLGLAQYAMQIGGAAANLGQSIMSAYFDSQTGQYVSGIFSGVASGAMAGTMIAPGIGTAVGAAAGLATGVINAISSDITEENNAFQETVKSEYERVKSLQQTSLSTGLGLATTRQTDLIAFKTLLEGDADAAQDFQQALIDIGRTPPFSYDLAASVAKEFLGLGLSIDDVTDSLKAYEDVASAMGWSESQTGSLVNLLMQMRTTDQVSSRIFKTLSTMGINAYDYLEAATGQSQEEIQKRIGELSGEAVAQAITEGIANDPKFAGAAAAMMDSYIGLSNRSASFEADRDAAMGAGYTDARSAGLRDKIAWQEDNAEMLEQAYREMGAWEAEQENTRERMIREAYTATMESEEYQVADAANRGRMLAAAEAKAEAEYRKSDAYQIQLEAEKTLVDDLQADLGDSWKNFGYEMSLKFSEGLAEADYSFVWRKIFGDIAGASLSNFINSGAFTGGSVEGRAFSTLFGRASGQAVIPYDGFPILAHQGEVLLTAGQARAMRETPSVTLGGTYYIREDADIARVAEELYGLLQSAQESYVGA